MPRFLGLSALAVLALLPTTASAALVDATFAENAYVTVDSQITGIAWAPDASNRLFVARKPGTVRIVKNGALVTTPFSTDTVYTNSECGLIGIAFDPAFATNGYVYLFETVSASQQQIVRYTATGDVGGDRTVIKSGLPTAGNNHDGGAIAFGPDGMLYFAIGDLGNGTGVDTNMTSLAAKVSRITKTGATPLDNPFYDGAGTNADEIWGRGHRNPFTMTFHPATGSLWVNDVGTSYEKVFRVSRGDHAGYNDYEINQPTGFIRPTIHYRTNGTEQQNITPTGAVRAGNVTTVTLSSTVRLHKGQRVTIAGVTNTSFNGVAYVRSIPTSTTFTIDQIGADASSGAGTVTTTDIGGAMNGGVFYDGTQFPATHRGNFFFGDYNSGNLVRAVIAADQTADRVDVWGSGFSSYIDADVGPDGALYLARFGGNVVRVRHSATAQSIVLNKRNLRTSEGGSTALGVSLAIAPTADVTVSVTRASGDADVTASTGTLTFTSANWSTPQFVTVAAAEDADGTDDLATFSVASSGLTTEDVTVRVNDDEGGLSIVTSAPTLAVAEGSSSTFTVRLSAAPTSAVTIAVGASGDSDVTVSPPTLTFDTDWATPKTVTVSAAQDTDATSDTATIALVASGLTTRNVAVTVSDDEPAAPVITSTPVTTAVLGAPYAYDVNASGTPAPTFALDTTVNGMTIVAATGVIAWTPTVLGPVNVTVRAANGVSPEATQSFVVTVAADTAPTAVITRPLAGEIVSGTMAEFYGDGVDDVATVKAEFAIDGVVISTDTAAGGHYHVNGTHNLWDTTTLSDGPHVARMTVFDTQGLTGSVQRNIVVANSDGGVDASADVAADTAAADAASDATTDSAVPTVDAFIADGSADAAVVEGAVPAEDDGGCGCRTSGRANATPLAGLVALSAWLASRRKGRRSDQRA